MERKRRPAALARLIEQEPLFQEECARLGKISQTRKLTSKDIYELRQKVGRKLSLSLSIYWEQFFLLKIKVPHVSLSTLVGSGTTIITLRNPETGETWQAIEVFPEETTLADVKEAYGRIIGKEEKRKLQPSKYEAVMPEILSLREQGLTDPEIAERLQLPGIVMGSDIKQARYRHKKKLSS